MNHIERRCSPEPKPPRDFFKGPKKSFSKKGSKSLSSTPPSKKRGETVWQSISGCLFSSTDAEKISIKVLRYVLAMWQLHNGLHYYLKALKNENGGILNKIVTDLTQIFDDVDFEPENIKKYFETGRSRDIGTISTSRRDELYDHYVKSKLSDSCEEIVKLFYPYFREDRPRFIPDLRKVIAELKTVEETGETLPLIMAVEKVSYYFYAKVNLHRFMETLVVEYDRIGAEAKNESPALLHSCSDKLTARIEKLYDHCCALSYGMKAPPHHLWVASVPGFLGIGLDTAKQINLPQVSVRLELSIPDSEGRTMRLPVKALAFGTPTPQDFSAEISPEFRMFLRRCRRKGYPVLYGCVQSSIEKTVKLTEAEKKRTDPLFALAESEEFRDIFHLLCINKDSSFHKQDGIYEFSDDAQWFKKRLLFEFLYKNREASGNFISVNIKSSLPRIKTKIILFALAIHKILFKNKKEIPLAERKVFIDLLTDLKTVDVIGRLIIRIICLICKDATDRGAEAIARLWAFLCIVFGKDRMEEYRKIFEILLLARAEAIKKRSIHDTRFNRCVASVKYYEEHSKELRLLYQIFFEEGEKTEVQRRGLFELLFDDKEALEDALEYLHKNCSDKEEKAELDELSRIALGSYEDHKEEWEGLCSVIFQSFSLAPKKNNPLHKANNFVNS